jgi:hypothetical protein
MREGINKLGNFCVRHKIFSLLMIIFATIFLTRALVLIHDPDIIIKNFELHHFWYGLILLVIVSLLMLFGRGNFKLHLAFTGISLGLIIDEVLFMGTKVRGEIDYSSTFFPTIIFVVIFVLIAEGILYFFPKIKSKK